jgi:putative PIN family toxin of toxin-antitoxin system
MYKIIIDNSVLVSYLISKNPELDTIIDLVKNKKVELFYSKSIFKELQESLAKPKIKKLILNKGTSFSARLVAWYKYNATQVEVNTKVEICRDIYDYQFLELSKEINADFLISLDNDLLVLTSFENTRICKPKDFIVSL